MSLNNDEKINVFLKYLDKYRFIAHRLGFLMEGYPENSFANIESFFSDEEALACCNGFEFDMQFTSDHIPMIIHDFKTADIGEENKSILKSTYDEIKNIKCGYRKSEYNSSIPWGENKNFFLHTVESLLGFLADNRNRLGDRVIKMETKFPILKKEDMQTFKELLKRYDLLSDNIIHLSFFPWHLHNLRTLQKEEGLQLTKTELLADFSFERGLVRFVPCCIDGISLGVKTESIKGNMEISKDAQSMANLIATFTQNRNAVSESWLKQIIETYDYAGIYTINSPKDIIELLDRTSPEFFDEYADRLVITSDNPKCFKKM